MFNFVRIPNNIVKALMKSDISKRQMKVILCIMRFSYGFNKAHALLNRSEISNLTGLYQNAISIELKHLINKQIIMADLRYRIFIINDHPWEWIVSCNKKINLNEYTDLIKKVYSKQYKKLSDLDKETVKNMFKQRGKSVPIDIKDNIDRKDILKDDKKVLIDKFKWS